MSVNLQSSWMKVLSIWMLHQKWSPKPYTWSILAIVWGQIWLVMLLSVTLYISVGPNISTEKVLAC